MAKIKEQDIDLLREKADIVEVISAYTTLKRSGGHTFKGLCPIHDEKTPSFTVDAARGLAHCLAGETGVITWNGTFPISKLAGDVHRLLTSRGVWTDAEIRSFGEQQLWAVNLSRNRRKKTIYATDGHRWLIRHPRLANRERTTKDLLPGYSLAYAYPNAGNLQHTGPSAFGVAHGFTFGDGQWTPYGCIAQFCGEKDQGLLEYFPKADMWFHDGRTKAGRLPKFFKERPPLDEAPAYLYGWLAGYFAADGCVSKDGQVILSCADRDTLDFVRTVANRLGIGTYGVKRQRRLGLGTELSDLFHLTFISSTLHENFFVLEKHRERFIEICTPERKARERKGWVVESVEQTDRFEEVFCAVVPGTHAFTLEDNILTGNCFGCGWGGNLYQFIQEKENLTFPEAVEWLARKTGYHLHYEEETAEERKNKGLKPRILDANRIAAEFYHQQLMDNPQATEARTYLGRRGFKRDVAKRWMLGYAPGRDATCKLLLSKGFSKEEIVAADLGRISDRDGALYDSFRQRITFPTWDVQNEVVAFGARALGDQQPKYLNTSETPVFSKSRFMYGLNRAKSSIARDNPAIVVEGYTDVIALHEAGLAEAVATNGTALGESHLSLLRKYTDRVILVFDADEAGTHAAMRGFGDVKDPLFRQVGLDILVATVPPGRDPADLIREDGADAMRKVIDSAAPVWDAKLEQTIASLPLDTPEARSRAVRAAAQVLRSHPDEMARHQYADRVATRIGIDVEAVHRALAERGGLAERPEAFRTGDRRLPGHIKVEREALRLLLVHGDQSLDHGAGLDESMFTAPARRELFKHAIETSASGYMTGDVPTSLSPDALSLYTELTVGSPPGAVTDSEIREVFVRLSVFKLEREIRKRRATLQEVNPMDDAERHDALFTELVGLEAERRDLLRTLQGVA